MVIGAVQGHFYLIPTATADVRCPVCGGETRVYCSRIMGAVWSETCMGQYRKCQACRRTAKTRYVLP